MLLFNAGVQIAFYTPRLGDPFAYACVWSLRERIDVYVTSIDDRQHGPNTLHGFSLAVDFGVAGNRMDQLERLHGFFARYLPLDYDVILERDHVHVEYDTHRKTAPIAPPAVRSAPAPV